MLRMYGQKIVYSSNKNIDIIELLL
jgi:hypothetical protein